LSKAKKILLAPLDWGLGHASRCIPIIKACLENGSEVVIAGTETTNALIRLEFPQLNYLDLKGYNIFYTNMKWMLPLSMILQFPKILLRMRHENNWLKRVVAESQIDLVISDNRYGLYHSEVPCFFITHQLQIQVPQSKWVQQMVNKLNHSMIKKFTICLVPDYEKESMSADLSQKGTLENVVYLGNLSRFNANEKDEKKYDLLLILSGPEPQRSLLEEKFKSAFEYCPYKTLIVRGKPGSNLSNNSPSHKTVDHLNAKELQTAILSAEIIICRSGYSSVMDLIKLNRHAVLIPTPGQTEQEYLGKYLMDKKWFLTVGQDTHSLQEILDQYHSFPFQKFPEWDLELYKEQMSMLLS